MVDILNRFAMRNEVGAVTLELRLLKPWEDPSKPCDARAHKITAPARYPVKIELSELNNT